jgi:hypothetical protein
MKTTEQKPGRIEPLVIEFHRKGKEIWLVFQGAESEYEPLPIWK